MSRLAGRQVAARLTPAGCVHYEPGARRAGASQNSSEMHSRRTGNAATLTDTAPWRKAGQLMRGKMCFRKSARCPRDA